MSEVIKQKFEGGFMKKIEMKEPIDKLTLEIIKNGIIKKVPALHPGWAAPRTFINFAPVPCLDVLIEEEDALQHLSLEQELWMDRMNYFIGDLKWLLHLPHHRFWSQIVYDEGVHEFLNSFLSNAPRFYDSWNPYTTPTMIETLQEAFHLVFLVYIRMATYKETKDSHITPSEFANIIYENYIFDISKIMDLCILYHNKNGLLLRKMVENIFKQQPKYLDDLRNTIPIILEALNNIENQLGLTSRNHENMKLVEMRSQLSTIRSLSWHDFEDTVLFLLDISTTLSAFLEVYPPSSEVFYEECVPIRIASFYDFVIPIIQEELRRRLTDSEFCLEKKDLQKKLTLIKNSFLKIFRNVVTYRSIYLLKNSEVSDQLEFNSCFAEDYFETLMNVLSDKNFISDYQRKFSVEEDVDYFHSKNIPLDTTRIEYILDGIHSFSRIFDENKTILQNLPTQAHKKFASNSLAEDSEQNIELYGEGACASKAVTGVELDSLISQVQDLLPDLGDGFVAACLEYYNYETEKVINSVLENNLPPSLAQLSRSLSRRNSQDEKLKTVKSEESCNDKPKSSEQGLQQSEILSLRKNVFDNDEFDVFNRDHVDKSKIFKGKRAFKFDGNKYLDDKTQVEKTKELFRNMSIDEEYDNANMYNDEYDDTYEENTVGASEPDKFETYDIYNRRPFVTPEVLARTHKVSDSDSDEEREPLTNGYEANTDQKKEIRDCFVPNPEELRRKAEERRQQRFEKRTWKPRQFVNSNYDVKGKPKGQGQNETVTKNRNVKERQKGSRSNHNRKNQADWKRSRGMIPS